jgi:hypothetical protein
MGAPYDLSTAQLHWALLERDRLIEELQLIARRQHEEQQRVRAAAERKWRAEQSAEEQLDYARRGYSYVDVHGVHHAARVGPMANAQFQRAQDLDAQSQQAQDASTSETEAEQRCQEPNGDTGQGIRRVR